MLSYGCKLKCQVFDEGDNIMIAVGSSPARPPIPGIDNDCVYDSTRLLDIDAMPGAIIGRWLYRRSRECEYVCGTRVVAEPVDKGPTDSAGCAHNGDVGTFSECR